MQLKLEIKMFELNWRLKIDGVCAAFKRIMQEDRFRQTT